MQKHATRGLGRYSPHRRRLRGGAAAAARPLLELPPSQPLEQHAMGSSRPVADSPPSLQP